MTSRIARDHDLQTTAPKRQGAIPINTGDRVACSACFLRCTGMITGTTPRMRGTVASIEPVLTPGFTFANIDWDDGRAYPVNVANLTLVSRIAVDSALNT